MTIEDQPVNTVEWVDPKTLRANDYNPNHVAPPEMALLKLSIMENGWTQPIVARTDGEIVDGFHRYSLGLRDSDIRGLTGGLVPVVRLNSDPVTQRMATIRHNRARGTHAVVKMADIVEGLTDLGETNESIAKRLGMESEEVARLRMRGGMASRGGKEFNSGWVPGTVDERTAAAAKADANRDEGL